MRRLPSTHYQRGFTLIELLVVVAIIGLLSSVILSSLSNARMKGRDARRMADMEQIRTALELYYNDHTAYPSTSGLWVNSLNASPWISGLTSGYIQADPIDPINVATPDLVYYYNSDGQNYCLQISEESSGATGNQLYWGNWGGSYKFRSGEGSPSPISWCQNH